MNLIKLIEEFSEESHARYYLEELRWPDGIKCPRCENDNVSAIKDRPQYRCNVCDYQFSVKSGTVLNDSHLPIWKWFLATYLMTDSKKGMSACQIQRALAVSYPTAWYLCHRIRSAIKEVNPEPLKGTVEVDETYVGGKVRGRGRGYSPNLTPNLTLVLDQVGGLDQLVHDELDFSHCERFTQGASRPWASTTWLGAKYRP